MDEIVRQALSRGQTIDITTTGRRTGQARRIEIVTHVIDGHLYISGLPSTRTRAWIRNLEANPDLTVHLKGPGVIADLPATARIITEPQERRRILDQVARVWRRSDVAEMVQFSPLIEVTIAGTTEATAA
jgi:deazaflavin-dependent oxidoreductase (nitroreductase family)